MNELVLRNRQRVRPVNVSFLREVTEVAVGDLLKLSSFEICVHLVGSREMARLNEQFLQHEGDTDVITFDYNEPRQSSRIAGEIFVCVDVALRQAKEFHTTWQAEIVRYVVHGVLHLLGHDDLEPAARRRMKREENALLRRLQRRFALNRVQKRAAPRA
ncbi:MAG: rRNA maturation RNase YbeY [Verrucomicrobiota bacterium]